MLFPVPSLHSLHLLLAGGAGRLYRPLLRVALAACLAACFGSAQAGRTCTPMPLTPNKLALGLDLAQRTAQALDASGAEVVLLARAGQDLSSYGLRYSHVGWAVKEAAGWRVVHKLNRCGTDRAALFKQGLGEFFSDDPWRYEAAFAVPTPEVQARLRAVLTVPASARRLHTARYNMVAYPWARTYQQSNQWAIETLALAMEPGITQRADAQAWLRMRGYRPAVLEISATQRLGARIGMANVAFDDHPFGPRMAGHIATVSADSVFDWLVRAQLAGGLQRLP
jgi:hypothetical protein